MGQGPITRPKMPSITVLLVWGLAVAGLLALFFETLHNGSMFRFLHWVRLAGWLGTAIGVVVMAVFSAIPVPSEFISIGLMNIYGVWPGMLYSWLGGILGALLAVQLTRYTARPFALQAVRRHLPWLQGWIRQRGALGLLIVRFVPLVPYHLVNYMAGSLGVRTSSFIWTTALGTLPFQLGLAGVYAGFAYGTILPLILGGLVLTSLFVLGWVFRRRWLPDLPAGNDQTR